MQGRTHMAVGASLTLLLLRPESIAEVVLGTAVATVGSLISDMDSDASISSKKSEKIIKYTATVCAALFIIEVFFHIGILKLLLLNNSIVRIAMGFLGSIVICVYGRDKDHRTFMHSILMMVILSACIGFIVPSMMLYFMVGFASHLLLDLFNYRGVQLFYPMKARFCFNLCRADGQVNRTLLGIGSVSFFAVFAYFMLKNLL